MIRLEDRRVMLVWISRIAKVAGVDNKIDRTWLCMKLRHVIVHWISTNTLVLS